MRHGLVNCTDTCSPYESGQSPPVKTDAHERGGKKPGQADELFTHMSLQIENITHTLRSSGHTFTSLSDRYRHSFTSLLAVELRLITSQGEHGNITAGL